MRWNSQKKKKHTTTDFIYYYYDVCVCVLEHMSWCTCEVVMESALFLLMYVVSSTEFRLPALSPAIKHLANSEADLKAHSPYQVYETYLK